MRSQKPYLVRALYDWILDSGYTPYLQVLVDYPGVQVPSGFDEEGVMVLNVSPTATQNLQLGNDQVQFWARFRGTPMGVQVPMEAVLAIFAKENGQGMGFPPPDEQALVEARERLSVVPGGAGDAATSNTDAAPASSSTASGSRERGHLRVIK